MQYVYRTSLIYQNSLHTKFDQLNGYNHGVVLVRVIGFEICVSKGSRLILCDHL